MAFEDFLRRAMAAVMAGADEGPLAPPSRPYSPEMVDAAVLENTALPYAPHGSASEMRTRDAEERMRILTNQIGNPNSYGAAMPVGQYKQAWPIPSQPAQWDEGREIRRMRAVHDYMSQRNMQQFIAQRIAQQLAGNPSPARPIPDQSPLPPYSDQRGRPY